MHSSVQIMRCGQYNSNAAPDAHRKKTDPVRIKYYKLELFLNDSGVVVINNNKYPIASGSILFAKAKDINSYYLPFQTLYIHFTVTDAALKALLKTLPCFLTPEKNFRIKEDFLEIIRSFYSSSALERFSAEAKLIALLSRINQFEETVEGTNLLSKAKKFIEQHYAEDLSISSIAAHCNISETHLYRIFRKGQGCSPNEFLLEQRLSAARNFLCNSDLSIGEIALSCGFSSQSYFSDCFKRKNNSSPSQFRSVHQYPA